MTGHQLDVTPFTNSGPAHPAHPAFWIQASKSRAASFFRKMLWETVKAFTTVQVDTSRDFPSPTNQPTPCHRSRSGCQAGSVFHKSVQPGPDLLVVLDVPCDDTQGDLFLPHQTDRPVIYQIVHPALLVDQYHIC